MGVTWSHCKLCKFRQVIKLCSRNTWTTDNGSRYHSCWTCPCNDCSCLIHFLASLGGGATALIMAARAEVLLKLGRQGRCIATIDRKGSFMEYQRDKGTGWFVECNADLLKLAKMSMINLWYHLDPFGKFSVQHRSASFSRSIVGASCSGLVLRSAIAAQRCRWTLTAARSGANGWRVVTKPCSAELGPARFNAFQAYHVRGAAHHQLQSLFCSSKTLWTRDSRDAFWKYAPSFFF